MFQFLFLKITSKGEEKTLRTLSTWNGSGWLNQSIVNEGKILYYRKERLYLPVMKVSTLQFYSRIHFLWKSRSMIFNSSLVQTTLKKFEDLTPSKWKNKTIKNNNNKTHKIRHRFSYRRYWAPEVHSEVWFQNQCPGTSTDSWNHRQAAVVLTRRLFYPCCDHHPLRWPSQDRAKPGLPPASKSVSFCRKTQVSAKPGSQFWDMSPIS